MSFIDDINELTADKLLFKVEKVVCVHEHKNKVFNYEKAFYLLLISMILLLVISRIVYGAT